MVNGAVEFVRAPPEWDVTTGVPSSSEIQISSREALYPQAKKYQTPVERELLQLATTLDPPEVWSVKVIPAEPTSPVLSVYSSGALAHLAMIAGNFPGPKASILNQPVNDFVVSPIRSSANEPLKYSLLS